MLLFFFGIIYAERLYNELRDRSRVEIRYKTLVKLDPVPWILDMYASPQNTERATKLAKMWEKSIIILVNILKYIVKYSAWNRLSRISHTYPILNTDINVLLDSSEYCCVICIFKCSYNTYYLKGDYYSMERIFMFIAI